MRRKSIKLLLIVLFLIVPILKDMDTKVFKEIISTVFQSNITPTSTTADSPEFDVVRVVDGDTIVVDYYGAYEKVRLIGIDTPESVHSDESKNTVAGVNASEYTKKLLADEQVTLEFDVEKRDQYDRLLAYVYVGNEMVNKKLLEDGIAVIATYPPNTRYLKDFERIADENKED